jgi:hypothetical protein
MIFCQSQPVKSEILILYEINTYLLLTTKYSETDQMEI